MDVVAQLEEAADRFMAQIVKPQILDSRMRQALANASLTLAGLYGNTYRLYSGCACTMSQRWGVYLNLR